MTHYCPECIEDPNEIDIEDYKCGECGDTYCSHFMKIKSVVLEFHDDDIFGYICLICGSEYRKKPNIHV